MLDSILPLAQSSLWTLVVTILGIAIIRTLRPELGNLINRLSKISGLGVNIDASQLQSDQQQEQAKPKQPELPQNAINLDDIRDTSELFDKLPADNRVYAILYTFEILYRIIFNAQLYLLKELYVRPYTRREIESWYATITDPKEAPL